MDTTRCIEIIKNTWAILGKGRDDCKHQNGDSKVWYFHVMVSGVGRTGRNLGVPLSGL